MLRSVDSPLLRTPEGRLLGLSRLMISPPHYKGKKTVAYQKLRSPKVYVPNKSFHDFSAAKKFGELVFLTEGVVNRTKINTIARQVSAAMEDAKAGDYIMISGLSVINSIASAFFAQKFGRLNFLFHDQSTNSYHSRTIVLDAIGDDDEVTNGKGKVDGNQRKRTARK